MTDLQTGSMQIIRIRRPAPVLGRQNTGTLTVAAALIRRSVNYRGQMDGPVPAGRRYYRHAAGRGGLFTGVPPPRQRSIYHGALITGGRPIRRALQAKGDAGKQRRNPI